MWYLKFYGYQGDRHLIQTNRNFSMKSAKQMSNKDEVAEWLRRWTANPLGDARVGSNPILVAFLQSFVCSRIGEINCVHLF